MEGSHAPWGTKKRLGIGLLMFSTKESSKHVFSLLNFIFFNLIFWAAFLISRCHSSNSSTIAVLRLKRVGAFGCLSYYDSAVHAVQFIGATMGSSELQIQTDNGQIGMPSNICCVVVEYLPGGALKSYLIKNRRRKLAFKVVIQLALDLARGLSYLHSQKIVHRDVKTENMLLDKTRTVKIADFGVARVEASNPNDMTGETGTLGYMAPEVLNGNPYNRKCDVYSFGICLWEIYCCDMPYPDLSFAEVTSAVVRQNLRPEIPRCCPSSLANVMKRCWDANPDKRPEMEEVVSMIEAIDTSKGGGMIPLDQSQGCLCFRKYRGP
ncbi:serine/threonine-protein kinase STY13-like isoform X2 [Carya illinoinensis]|uniref:serine/threonine-protein kinase STY13-like isoform X2 n=1 Tax=Carya illinoinensis TaxID=32201 RepID=UPI001C71FA4A|nr:serine/threonine-protein kinase STY13-like isoform X2 [Carya illinoinensis]